MKKLSFLFLLGFILSKTVVAQNYDNILNYNINATPTHGVKIKTNLPFVPDGGMPTITIKGYSYGPSEPINLTLTFYVWWIQSTSDPATYYFYNPRISSSGAYTPPIYLSNEGGKVVIFIDDRVYFQRFTVSAFGQGDNEILSWFQGWEAVDEPLNGTKTVEVPYRNRFKGEVFMPGNGLWSPAGNVGIGNTDPATGLDISSNHYLSAFAPGTGYGALHIRPANNTSDQLTGITFGANNGSGLANGAQAGVYVQSSAAYGTRMYFGTTDTYANGVKQQMTIDHSGNVGIGTTVPTEKLSVKGKIRAQEIKVENANWPDYVFTSYYQLPTLQQTEQHIKEKGHLPGIPSAEEVKANGVDLGEMNAKLLQKIEELTLYMIEQNKQIVNQQKVNQSAKTRLQLQQKQINELQKQLGLLTKTLNKN